MYSFLYIIDDKDFVFLLQKCAYLVVILNRYDSLKKIIMVMIDVIESLFVYLKKFRNLINREFYIDELNNA